MFRVFVILCGFTVAFGAKIQYGTRIMGGQTAADGQFPHMASMAYDGNHYCGAAILDETTVVTAVHCVNVDRTDDTTILVGTNNLSEGGVRHQAAKIIPNAKFDFWTLQDDIAIIKLATAIEFNEKVQPIKLPTGITPGGEDVIISGWGVTEYPYGEISNTLNYIQLKTIDHEECKAKQTILEVTEDMLCTLAKVGDGVCDHDSGSPLINSKGEFVGIVSWGTHCALGEPDVFTRVSSYLDWIEENRH